MIGGYVKLWREILDDALWRSCSSTQRDILITILLSTNWSDAEFGCQRCGARFAVPAGSFATSLRKFAARHEFNFSTVQRALSKFRRAGFLRIEKAGRCHALYVVENWDRFQGADADPGQRQVRGGSEAGQRRVQIKEGKNSKKRSDPRTLDPDNPGHEIAQAFSTSLREAGVLRQTRVDLATWARDLDRLHRIDGFGWDTIRGVCAWIPTNRHDPPLPSAGGRAWSGWYDKARSPAALREKKNGEPKFARVLIAYEEQRTGAGETLADRRRKREIREDNERRARMERWKREANA